jgi:histone-lysine N-methyltransferase SETMAR
VQGALLALQDWESGVLADSSRHSWLEKIHLRWVSHILSSNQKTVRMSDSRLILRALEERQGANCKRIITGDKFWFFLYYPRDFTWPASRNDLPEKIRQKIDTEKCLISILWSVYGIHSLVDLPKGTSYNSAFFCSAVVLLCCCAVVPSLVAELTSDTRPKTLKGFIIHMDNARPHNSGSSRNCIQSARAERLPHPPYSPGLAPSDFFFFGYIKEELTDYDCRTREELKSAIIEIFNQILLRLTSSSLRRTIV